MATLTRRLDPGDPRSPVKVNVLRADFSQPRGELLNRRVTRTPIAGGGHEVKVFETVKMHSPGGTLIDTTPMPIQRSPRRNYADIAANLPQRNDARNPSTLRTAKSGTTTRSLIDFEGPFATTKFDLFGRPQMRTREEMASGYQDMWPDLYEDFVSGSIGGSELFNRALHRTVGDQIGEDPGFGIEWTASDAPRVSMTFGKSGGGRYSFSGGGFSF